MKCVLSLGLDMGVSVCDIGGPFTDQPLNFLDDRKNTSL